MKPTEPATDGSDSIVDPFPPDLGSTTSKLVYLHRQITDEATIDGIQNALGAREIALYSLSRVLRSAGLLHRTEATHTLHERMNRGGAE